MRRNVKRIVSIIVMLFCLVITPIISVKAENDLLIQTETEKRYEYPLTSASEEWGELNHAERVLALQIPENILESLSTEELIEVVLDYPCFGDMFFYPSYQEGYEAVMQHFNGLQELYKREDVGSSLVSVYSEIDINDIVNQKDGYEQFLEVLRLTYFDTIISQKFFQEKMTATECEVLNKQQQYIKRVISGTAENKDADVCSTRASIIIDDIDVYDITVTLTPGGSLVEIWSLASTDRAYLLRSYYKQHIESEYPGAEVVGDATLTYNCHAYAWMRTTSYWLNDPTAFMTDGTYTRLSSNAAIEPGQVIYYPYSGNEHSGLVISTSGNSVRSKWGPQSLVEHARDNCPYFFAVLATPFIYYESEYY